MDLKQLITGKPTVRKPKPVRMEPQPNMDMAMTRFVIRVIAVLKGAVDVTLKAIGARR